MKVQLHMCARNISVVLDKLKAIDFNRNVRVALILTLKVNVETYFKHFRQTVVIKIIVQ